MEELFQRLERKIKELVSQCNTLSHSNHQLHQGKSTLSREKDHLLARQQKAIIQIESLLTRLKAIEKGP